MSLCSELFSILGKGNIRINESLIPHTTFRSGGPCDYFLMPENEEQLANTIETLKKAGIPWFIIGRGSNILVSDKGFRGAVISLKTHFRNVRFEEDRMICDAGVMMGDAAKEALKRSLTGFEFASGIPGTVGGGLRMNAGAYGEEFKDIVTEARLYLNDGQIRTFTNDELKFSYRSSVIKDLDAIALSVTFQLRPGNEDAIRERMAELQERRKEKQPLEYGSAGSTFKRPPGYFAGAVIEQAGLKGYRYGDAGVSEKHANFVINYGQASSAEILYVIRHVQEVVKEQTGLILEPEVLFIGEF